MVIWNDPRWVARTPLATVVLLEGGNFAQLWRMWHVHSSLGQNVWGWLSVNLALWAWLNFYRVCVPKTERTFAMWTTAIGIAINASVCATVWWFG